MLRLQKSCTLTSLILIAFIAAGSAVQAEGDYLCYVLDHNGFCCPSLEGPDIECAGQPHPEWIIWGEQIKSCNRIDQDGQGGSQGKSECFGGVEDAASCVKTYYECVNGMLAVVNQVTLGRCASSELGGQNCIVIP